MADKNSSLYDLIDQLEEACNLKHEHSRLAKVAIATSESILKILKKAGVDNCLAVAHSYWNFEATETDLEKAKTPGVRIVVASSER
jgi:hypothetical protein